MVEFKEITSREEFEKEVKESRDKVVFLKFQGEWCGPCKVYGDNLRSLKDEVKDLVVLEADIDTAENLALEFNVRSIPSTFVYYNGDLKDQFVGLRTKEGIIEEINKILE